MSLSTGIVGTNTIRQATATAGTAFLQIIEPCRCRTDLDEAPIIQTGSGPNTLQGSIADVITHIESIDYRSGGTAHTGIVMRPLNYAIVNGAPAGGATSITLTDDPGIYSTNYKYPLVGGTQRPAAVSDNAIAANDYYAVQMADGTWWWDKITSVAGLVLTVPAIPNSTLGGGIKNGTRLYFFGIQSDKDPATGFVQPQMTFTATAGLYTWPATPRQSGAVQALHPGDPMLFYSANGTNAGTLENGGIMYLKR